MKISAAFLLIWAISPAWAVSDGFRITYQMEQPGLGVKKPSTITYYVRKGFVRFEMEIGDSPRISRIMIARPTSPKAVMLIPEAKSYIDFEEFMTKISSTKMREVTDENTVPFRNKGGTKTIAKHVCNIMERDVGNRHEEACVSSEYAAEFQMLKESMPSMGDMKSQLPAGLNGFALEYRVKTKANAPTPHVMDTVMVAKELRRETLSDDLFAIPPDYAATTHPLMDKMTVKTGPPKSSKKAKP